MEELDLSNSKWTPENEIYLMSISESIKENYPFIDFKKELDELEYCIEDLINPEKIRIFMSKLNKKYPC
jgi:hypothetical protein